MSIGSPSPFDTVKASLKAHNDSFDQLLRHIPAQYYFLSSQEPTTTTNASTSSATLTKSQKKAARKLAQQPEIKQAKAEKLKEARLARYDPNEPHTIPEILSLQASKLNKNNNEDDSESDSDEEAEVGSASEEGSWQDEPDSANETDFNDSDPEDGDEIALPTLAPRNKNAPVPTVMDLKEKLQKRIGEIQAAKRKLNNANETERSDEGMKSKEDLLEERRRRGAMRDSRRKRRKEERKSEVKTKDKLPSNGRKGGGKANAPGRNGGDDDDDAEEGLSRPSKKSKTDQALVPSSQAVAHASSSKSAPPPADAFTFSNLDFTNSQLAVANASSAAVGALKKKKNRHDLPKDANAALSILASRKEKLETLTPEQRERVEEKDKWDKAAVKAEGGKVRDDEKRLKKMAKRQERQKGKSAKTWAARKETVQDNISARISKRNENLAAREKQRKEKKMGIKNKSSAGAKKTKSKSHAGRSKTGGGGKSGKGKSTPGFK